MSYVRPHELQILAEPTDSTVAVTLVQALTVGPNTRLEFKRVDDAGLMDVELARAEYVALRDQLGLKPGSAMHLRPRRVTRFAPEQHDPAAMI